MLNLRNCWKIHQSVVVVLVLCSVFPLPAFAQLPPFTEEELSPAPEPEFIRLSADKFSNDYILGPGDRIQVNVFGYEEFTDLFKIILQDGNITLPLIGSYRAAGKTTEAIQKELTTLLEKNYLVDPLVTVNLVNLRPVIVNVAGEVERPGPIQIDSLTTGLGAGFEAERSRRLPTVSLALITAGGVTRRADISQIELRRSIGGGKSVTTTINFWDALQSGALVQDLPLQDGDSIFVPPLVADTTLDPKLLARSTLAPETVRVRVAGEVKRPGEVEVTPESSLSSAVAIAGGPTIDADLEEVRFIRLNEEGIVVEQEIDLSTLTDNYQIQEGDVIYVPRSERAQRLDYAGRFSGPLNTLMNILRIFSPLPIGGS